METQSKGRSEKTMNRARDIQDEKIQYLVKTFSRTLRKDFENYVINAVWQQVAHLGLEPVTQQYIKRADGKRAFVDLYFPQINVGVECLEEYHLSNRTADMVRSKEITKTLGDAGKAHIQELTAEEKDGFRAQEAKKILAEGSQPYFHKMRRANVDEGQSADYIECEVRVYNTFDEMVNGIQDAVTTIKNRVEQLKPEAWKYSNAEYYQSRDYFDVKDNRIFHTIEDFCTLLFGMDFTQSMNRQKSYSSLNNMIKKQCGDRFDENMTVWFPELAIKDENGESISPGALTWRNTLSDDGKTIFEEETDGKPLRLKDYQTDRIVFAKCKDVLNRKGYKFIGVFRPELAGISEPVSKMKFTRIDTKHPIIR